MEEGDAAQDEAKRWEASKAGRGEKGLLRYAYADGLSADRIGAVYGVHRATASRWVNAARDKLVARVVEELVDRLDVTTSEVPSVLRAALSQVPSTIVRHLRDA